jgi:hypothetical protein
METFFLRGAYHMTFSPLVIIAELLVCRARERVHSYFMLNDLSLSPFLYKGAKVKKSLLLRGGPVVAMTGV